MDKKKNSGEKTTGKKGSGKKTKSKKKIKGSKTTTDEKNTHTVQGRRIEQTIILEDGGIVESHWQIENSKRAGARTTRKSEGGRVSVATRDPSLDPVFSARGDAHDQSIRKIAFDEKYADESDGDKDKDKDSSDCCSKAWRMIVTHKIWVLTGTAVLSLIIFGSLLAVFLSPGKRTARSTAIRGISNDTETTGVVIGIQDDTDIATNAPSSFTQTETIVPINDDGNSYTKLGNFDLLQIVPHDINAFTQGLEILSQEKIEIMKERQEEEVGLRSLRTLRSVSRRSLAEETSYVLESTGQYLQSTLRIVELETGTVVEQFELENQFFAEGCTYYSVPNNGAGGNDVVRIVQITWKEGRGFVYELSVPSGTITTETEWSLSRIGEFEILADDHTTEGQGWGIVYHPLRDQFIVSDGTSFLYVWELKEYPTETGIGFNFEMKYRMTVREDRTVPSTWTALDKVNELEWDPYAYGGNTILANIWKSNEIVRIWVGAHEEEHDDNTTGMIETDDAEGRISHVYDLSVLETLAQPYRSGSVLNGIAFAYDSVSGIRDGLASADQFWVTGKRWRSMYRIKLIDN